MFAYIAIFFKAKYLQSITARQKSNDLTAYNKMAAMKTRLEIWMRS